MSWATDKADTLYRRVLKSTNFAYDPRRACDELDIDVVLAPMPDGMYGQSIISNRNATIFLNDAISDAFRKYVLCHELGHCVMHRSESTPFMRSQMHGGFVPTIEREANEFALRYLLKQLDPEELEHMSRQDILGYFGVPQDYERFIII
jgi:Zn-dependent peptidase ImmA (M78 family)